ncbi:hypothetical protein RE476_10950 [Methanolobus mangrovi]|uniref:Uncharacterized protein n=1 Tax=Methanolobus mangrovi TaxID=3072977 RepID=A0AA51UEX2_9EURY|nr:hypothetical protein [Methanolobus mangrovi]WMW21880.1 hypothetical protein RE476_10950 [Methanolobus mangrovi]
MLNDSTTRTIFMAILLLSCTVTNAYASMFELEIVPISKIKEDPTVYDSTMAYRKISVIGNISELTKQSAILVDGQDSLKIDISRIELFDGFNINDQIMTTGEFIYEPVGESTLMPTYVLHYPIEDMGLVNISSIVSDPADHNGRYMTVVGNVSSREMSMGRYTITIVDSENNAMKIYYYGSTELGIGDDIKAFGLYNGNALHSESMTRNKSPLSITTLVPGFSSIMGAVAILSLALLLKSKQRND